MNYTKKRWKVFIAACLINICLGSIDAWSILALGLSGYLTQKTGHTITVSDLAIVYTIANSVGPITMITGGWFNDHFGPRKVIMLGGTMFAVGMILSGFASNINTLIVTYGLISGLGLGMAYGTTVSTCMKFFPDKRGIIGGINTAVYGLGSVILPPLFTRLLLIMNGGKAFILVGLLFLIIILLSSLFMYQCPPDFIPEGYIPIEKESKNNYTWIEMIKSKIFYIMLVLYGCGTISGLMVISQASSVAVNQVGMSLSIASLALSLLALSNMLGRMIAGAISDQIGRINTLSILSLLSMIGLFILSFVGKGQNIVFIIGICIIGFCYGGYMGIYPGFTSDKFGDKNNSINYGIMFIGFALAGYIGPTLMGSIYKSTGTYNEAFIIAIIFSMIGLLLTIIYRCLNKNS